MTFKIGDRVRYKSEGKYGLKPTRGSIGVVGSVESHTGGIGYTCFVTWATKKRGSHYYGRDLELAENGLDIMLKVAFDG